MFFFKKFPKLDIVINQFYIDCKFYSKRKKAETVVIFRFFLIQEILLNFLIGIENPYLQWWFFQKSYIPVFLTKAKSNNLISNNKKSLFKKKNYYNLYFQKYEILEKYILNFIGYNTEIFYYSKKSSLKKQFESILLAFFRLLQFFYFNHSIFNNYQVLKTDCRQKERKKTGLKKARKKPKYSKR